jgi:hypothetical protein
VCLLSVVYFEHCLFSSNKGIIPTGTRDRDNATGCANRQMLSDIKSGHTNTKEETEVFS